MGPDKEGSSSFLKKSTKKLLFVLGSPRQHRGDTLKKQKFFGSFFQERTACLLSFLPIRDIGNS
jgi:hypothetical protein